MYGRRSLCSSIEHQWGLAITAYSVDNSGQLLQTCTAFPPGRYPDLLWWTAANELANGSGPGEITVDAIKPYAPGLDQGATGLSTMFVCPSSGTNSIAGYSATPYVGSQYSYFRASGLVDLPSHPPART